MATGRLLQVTVAISPSAAKGASKGWFSARIRSEGPHRQMQDFETGGERGAATAKQEVLATGRNRGFPGELPSRCVFKRCICRGTFRLEETRKQRSAFFENLSAREYGWLRLSVFPDFVVFPASWSGADASHIPALNTSSTHALHCFRTFCQQDGSPTNTDLPLIAHTEHCHHSRSRMASDHSPDIIDQDIVNAHLLAYELCHILCVFDAVPVCDQDKVIVPAF